MVRIGAIGVDRAPQMGAAAGRCLEVGQVRHRHRCWYYCDLDFDIDTISTLRTTVS